LKVRSDGHENIICRTNFSGHKAVDHRKKQTNVGSCKKERHFRDTMGTSAKLKTMASLILDAEDHLNMSAKVEERIKEKYRKIEAMCLNDLAKNFNPIESSSRLQGVVQALSATELQ